MAYKKIRQAQIENLIQDLKSVDITNLTVSGTGTKTLTITFQDGSTETVSWTDKDTTYTQITTADLVAGTSTVPEVIAAKTLVDYLNSRLSAAMNYKGTVANFSALPTSGMHKGDVYNVQSDYTKQTGDPLNDNIHAGDNVVWNGTQWDVLSHWIDMSQFITSETDPKGVASVDFSPDTPANKTSTITITLNDASTVTGTLYYQDTTYPSGTTSDITGSDTTIQVWSGKEIHDAIQAMTNNLQLNISQECITATSGDIGATNVTLTLANSFVGPDILYVYLNGVKQPNTAYSASGVTLTIVQANIATPIVVNDEVEVVYRY